jgi:hypothetical protein
MDGRGIIGGPRAFVDFGAELCIRNANRQPGIFIEFWGDTRIDRIEHDLSQTFFLMRVERRGLDRTGDGSFAIA